MIIEITELLEKHLKWLRDKTTIEIVDSNWAKITSPYLDRHNDYIQIYINKINDKYILSDGAYTINDLISCGCNLDTPKRKELLRITIAGFGVSLNDGTLEITTTKDDFPIKKHNFIQAILAVNDLFYFATPLVLKLFREYVENWLNLMNVRYTPKIKLTGRSGFDHLFDFVIPKSNKQPERILQTINYPSRSSAESFAFKWLDTKDTRSKNSQAYTILNDNEQIVSQNVFFALQKYNANPVIWSKKESIEEILKQ